MVEWRAQISLTVRQALRTKLEEIANLERRKPGKISEMILEWGFKQLMEVGSTERLLRCRLRLPVEQTQPPRLRNLAKVRSAMDELKAPLSVSVREALRTELERVAAGERKKLSEIAKLILEWSVSRLDEAGSLNRLMECGIYLPDGLPRQPRSTD